MTAITLMLPFTPGFDRLFRFEAPTWQLMTFSIGIVLDYGLATEVTKRLFYAHQKPVRRRPRAKR